MVRSRGRAVEFFERRFKERIAAGDLALSDVESLILPQVRGRVLDLGCGLGNLALAAARRGCRVVAIDGSPTAVEHVKAVAHSEGLDVDCEEADLADYEIGASYDMVLAVGLLMFFPEERARRLLQEIKGAVAPGGIAAVNVLVQGTTYLEMFDPSGYFLFDAEELQSAFDGWKTLAFEEQISPAAGQTRKVFRTIIAEAPGK